MKTPYFPPLIETKHFQPQHQIHPGPPAAATPSRSDAIGWLLSALVAVFLCASCATRGQVQSIVAESNAAILASQIAGATLDVDSVGATNRSDWQGASRQIDEFIAAHPDQEVAAGALRIRQAILLLANGQFELARSAFNEASHLKTDRDRALKALSEPIIWWWQHSQASALNESQRNTARQYLDAFDAEIARLEDSPDIRDLLAELRIRIALKRVAALQLSQGKRDAFLDALNHYGIIFSPDDIAALAGGNLHSQSPAISTAEKRRLRALAVIQRARELAAVFQNSNQPVTSTELQPDPPSVRTFARLVLDE
jgi:hypothetical protein